MIAKARAERPEHRYRSAAALGDDLRRVLEQRPVLARDATPLYRLVRFVQRRWAAALTVGAVTLLLAGTTAFSWHQARVARLERNAARDTLSLLQGMLVESESANVARAASAVDLLDAARRELRTRPTESPAVALALHGTLALAYARLGVLGVAEEEARLAMALADLDERDAIARAEARRVLAVVLDAAGDHAAALAHYAEALALLGPRRDAEALRLLAQIEIGRGAMRQFTTDLAAAETSARRAIGILQRLEPRDAPSLGQALNNLAVVRGEQGRIEEAIALHREAIDELAAGLGPRHPRVARAESNLATVLDMAGRATEAEALFDRVLRGQREGLGDAHPDTLSTAANLAHLLIEQRRPGEAAALLVPIVERAASLPDEERNLAYARAMLGDALIRSGRPREALGSLEQSLAGRVRALGDDHPLVWNTRCLLGHARAAIGEADGEPEIRRAGEALARIVGRASPLTRRCAARIEAIRDVAAATAGPR